MNNTSTTPVPPPKIALIWGKWGPYHHARYKALVQAYGKDHCVGVALAGQSRNYAWAPVPLDSSGGRLFTLNPEQDQETLPPLKTGVQVYRFLRKERVRVAFVPSYWPARSFLILLASRLAGARCIMMNESHAGTERATGVKRWVKRQLLHLFRGGLVGGTPQVDHFTNLGMNGKRLFMGYDTVDNDYYDTHAKALTQESDAVRIHYGLPARYILNIGRMVEKKNLPLLIQAYAQCNSRVRPHIDSTNNQPDLPALVLIGSGPLEASLKALATQLGLEVAYLEPGRIPTVTKGTVFFAGFRQIEDNPAFYSLAEVFVLPSLYEEWGLVVNEAMASGLPVLVSRKAGCAPDLVKEGVNGFLFDPTDTGELSFLLERVLSDPLRRKEWGRASSALIRYWGCDLFAHSALKAVAQT